MTNPVMFSLAILMILAWKVAGFMGVDRFLLPIFGAPWRLGAVLQRRGVQTQGGRPLIA